MRSRLFYAAFVTSLLAVAPRARAQTGAAIEIEPLGGVTFFVSRPPARFAVENEDGEPVIVQDGSLDDAWTTLGLTAELHFSDRWSVAAGVTRAPTALTATDGPAHPGVDVYAYGLTGTFYVPDRERLGPLLGLGVGATTFDYTQTGLTHHTDLSAIIVGGFRYRISNATSFRMEARESISRFGSQVASQPSTWLSALSLTMKLGWRTPLAR